MKRYLLLIVVGFFIPVQLIWATHIVGGELELTSRNASAYTYTLALNLYFDAVNGEPGAEDATATVTIFNRRTHQAITSITLFKNLARRQMVPYSNPACTNNTLKTRLIRYEQDIVLNPNTFNDAGGYYVVWERCCRNGTIINIRDPGGAGSTFYLEFPAVSTNNRAFVNSSPVFAMPTGDYACVNRPFTFDFGATDADGDELRYSLAQPLSSYSSRVTPRLPPSPAPHPRVSWIPSISLNNVIPGPQPLRVDERTGQLRFTADRIGLFVFSVLCEELRNGTKIGEVRRDFQILVIDCPPNDPPLVQLKEKSKPNFYREGEVITLRASQADRCLDLLLADASNQTNVRVKINPLNFPANVVSITPSAGTIRGARDTLRSKLCWTECAASEPGNPYEFDVIIEDDGCPLPNKDTLRVKLIIEPLPNQVPVVQTTLPGNVATLLEGNTLTFNVNANDADLDQITLEAVGRGFNLSELGMVFINSTATGNITTPFVWQPICEKITEGQIYTVDFIVTDKRCPNIGKKDTVTVNLRFQSKPNQQPQISTTLPGNTTAIHPSQAVQFEVIGTDADQDPIFVRAIGRGFSLERAGMQFRNNAAGVGRVQEPFSWVPDCSALELTPDGKFVIDFILQDNTCAPNRVDTVSIEISVKDREFVIQTDSVPNAFTPDGDKFNPTFQLYKYLPPDNCRDQFVKTEIYNRWGRIVFESTNREFNWDGLGFPTGVYYYVVKYRKSQYKGTVSLLR